MYWYVSASKVKALTSAGRNPIRSLGLKVSAIGVAEAEVQMGFDATQERALKRLRKRLDDDPGVRPATELPAAPTGIFSFSGPVSRALIDGGYWLAVAQSPMAVLLVGSRTNAVGGLPGEGVDFSYSVDPVEAARQAFEGEGSESPELGSRLGYGWQQVMRHTSADGAVLPSVRGLAVFAGLYPMNEWVSKTTGIQELTSLVLGSPIYVEQI